MVLLDIFADFLKISINIFFLIKGNDYIMKKGILKYVLIVSCFVFLIYNIIWYFGTYKVFQEYQKSFPEVADSGVKIYVDEENYQYGVRIPSYLCWNGSMAVSEQNANHALVIWRGFGERKNWRV